MNTGIGFDKCLTFINCQIQPPGPSAAPVSKLESPYRAITISRQTGSGAHALGDALAPQLQRLLPGTGRPWTVFDRNLVETVLEDHHLPKRLAQFMPEDRIGNMRDAIDELLGLHPASWTLVHQTAETVLRLVDLGNVIIIGRGASIITRHLKYVFHLRLVGSLEKRIEYLQKTNGLTADAARDLIEREDRGRARYLKSHFDANNEDPLLYHLVINTDHFDVPGAVELVLKAMQVAPVPAAVHA